MRNLSSIRIIDPVPMLPPPWYEVALAFCASLFFIGGFLFLVMGLILYISKRNPVTKLNKTVFLLGGILVILSFGIKLWFTLTHGTEFIFHL